MSFQQTRREFLKTAAMAAVGLGVARAASTHSAPADIILINGRFHTVDRATPLVSAVCISSNRFVFAGTTNEAMQHRGPASTIIDLQGATVIPGLNDSHTHPIRGGLNYNMELRWDGVPSLADALRMLKDQAARTPPPQWVRVVGGWCEFQFAERRMPTLREINSVAPDTPVFVLHLYDRALLNKAALRAIGYTKDTPSPAGAEIERDRHGNPTGLLIARPNANLLYSTLAKGPKLSYEDQLNSTRLFLRELNRFGVTSVIDAGGGFQSYPDDYAVVNELHKRGELSVRLAYNLFTQRPKQELADFQSWSRLTKPGAGDDFLRMNGAGEMLVYSAADFEDFVQPRPDLAPITEDELKTVLRHLAGSRWPFRIHATYDETVTRILNVCEEVDRDVSIDGLHWFLDHCETISDPNIERIKKLGGGIAVQSRMAFQGEYFVKRYGKAQAARTPPIRRMLEMGIPVGAGTDGTRVSTYNPFVALHWLVSGNTVGGLNLYPSSNRLSRLEALRLFTVESSWFSSEDGRKGSIAPGQLADLAVLSADYFSVREAEIKNLESILTIVDGKVVYGAGRFANLNPPPLPVSPDWSPVKYYGGYNRSSASRSATQVTAVGSPHQHVGSDTPGHMLIAGNSGLWSLGCDCFGGC
jgi:predicted amidohydrolase YtcJ